MVFKFSACLILEKNQHEVFACFFETLTNFTKATYNFCSFALIGELLLVYIHDRLLEQFSESLAGFATFLKGTGGYKKAGTSSLKRVTGRNFTISK
jgi:hypothetical protein